MFASCAALLVSRFVFSSQGLHDGDRVLRTVDSSLVIRGGDFDSKGENEQRGGLEQFGWLLLVDRAWQWPGL